MAPSVFSRRYMLAPVDPTHGDIALLVCAFVTGLVDAASFNNWAVFVGMQTGNTVLLGLSTAGLPSAQPHATLTTLSSILSFLLGAFLTSFLAARARVLRRLTLVLSFGLQALLIAAAAALTAAGLVPQDAIGAGTALEDVRIVTALPPLAAQFGAQIAMSRVLGFGELPGNVLTSAYADLVGDAAFFRWRNRKRDRRLGAAVLILAGAVAGAWLMRVRAGLEVVLWVAAGLKMLAAVGMWLFTKDAATEAR